MGIPICKLVFDHHKRSSKNAEGSVDLRITFNRVQRFATTGVRLLPNQWRDGHVVNRMDAFDIQESLDHFVTHARRVINEQYEAGTFDMATIVGLVTGKDKQRAQEHVQSKMFLIDYMKERAQIRKHGKKVDTQERYDRFLSFFERWGGMVTFADVTELNVIKMDDALVKMHKTPMTEASRWHNYHRFLNSFIVDAIEDGLIKKNPYNGGLNIKKVECSGGLEKYLTTEEFERVKSAALPYEYLRHARDLFVFQTYTCMAYTDLESFDPERISMVKGKPMYQGNRGKTGIGYEFMIVKPAMEILLRYDYQLPIMCNQDYNKFLKTVAAMAGIKKPVTSHWARHTGATLLLNAGVDMEVVARILGHSSTKMTRKVYAKLLDSTIADAMGRVEGQF